MSYGFCSKFHTFPAVQNIENQLRFDRATDSLGGNLLRHKPVGFCGPIAPPVPNTPVPNAPSSECPRASIVARRAVLLRLIWTIMVAAKLDHSRTLVTKFHQNRSTLKGRSAGQTHTHTDRQTRLKIMALQVCNRANSVYTRQTLRKEKYRSLQFCSSDLS